MSSWNLYKANQFLNPLCFSNGKSQLDVVNEIVDAIESGEKIIFVHGVCGTGKSAIALNVASRLGKTSIVVPGKNLQAQYKKDYEGEKYLKKEDGSKLKISVITGRQNHKCKFLEDNSNAIPAPSPDSSLQDIFQKKKDSFSDFYKEDKTAANPYLPCKIEIREKNWYRLKEYLKQNKKVDANSINEIKDVKRLQLAQVCPYWSPVFPDRFEIKTLSDKKSQYQGLSDTTYVHYKRKGGCPFYEQFSSYIDSDVIVFNSLKYKLETALNRKPKTKVEIIDECDEFLDGLSNQRTINIDRLQNSLIQLYNLDKIDELLIEELFELISHFKKDPRLKKIEESKDILPIRATGIYDILKIFLAEEWSEEVDEESYIMEVVETAKIFKDFLHESYITVSSSEKQLIVGITTTNLAKKLNEFVEKNNAIVLMSGTLHSDDVLKNIFGLNNFKKIDAETKDQGTITIKKTGLEADCKYSNFAKGLISRRDYLKALDQSLAVATRPTLVHVNAFNDLPSEDELSMFNLKNLISREKLRKIQQGDSEGNLIKKFKSGEIDVLFSTRDSRGIDFPGDECKSIVFTKYPNPNAKDAFWKILMKTKPTYYWQFYKDKARREFLQKIYRGLRFKGDHIELLSPDIRVLDFIEKNSDLFS